MNNQEIEQEIQAKGLTAPRVTMDYIDSLIVDKTYQVFYGRMTICILRLKNGYLVSGESCCVSEANFNQPLGENIAFQNAYDKIWELEGYLLRDRLMMGVGNE